MSKRAKKNLAFAFVSILFLSCSSLHKNHEFSPPNAPPAPMARWKCQANVKNMKFEGSGSTLMTAQTQAKKACVSRFTADLCDELTCVVAP